MELKEAMYKCEISISDKLHNGVDDKYRITLAINSSPRKEKKINVNKKFNDNKKLEIINEIKKWYHENAKFDSKSNPTSFLNLYEDDIKNAIRIHNWKNIDQLKEDRQSYVNGIDKYTDYIESLRQQEAAERENDRLEKIIKLYDKVLIQMEPLINKYESVEYSFGYYRVKENGIYNFIKFNK